MVLVALLATDAIIPRLQTLYRAWLAAAQYSLLAESKKSTVVCTVPSKVQTVRRAVSEMCDDGMAVAIPRWHGN